MNLAVVSDTHVPGRAAAIPEWVRRRVEMADHTIHAGDFDSGETLAQVRELAGGDLTAVKGNIDGPDVDLPEIATLTVEDVTFVVTHGTGPRANYAERISGVVRETVGPEAIGVAGHTHEPMDDVVDGVQLLNPGTATAANAGDEATMLTARVDGSDVRVRLHRD